MKKLIVFMFLLLLFVGCKKEWHEDRSVRFSLTRDISFNQNDAVYSQVFFTIEYKIIGDPNADTSTVNVMDCTYEELATGYPPFWSCNFNNIHRSLPFKSYDHLEFKVTTAYNLFKPVNLKFIFRAETGFVNFEPDGRNITETLFTVNSPDTTIYFTWSPHNLPLN